MYMMLCLVILMIFQCHLDEDNVSIITSFHYSHAKQRNLLSPPTAAVKAIDEAGCDNITKRRVREVHEIPGALWQIYDAHDADKIRDFLNKVNHNIPELK